MIEAGHFAELENILRLTLLEAKYAIFYYLSRSILTENETGTKRSQMSEILHFR